MNPLSRIRLEHIAKLVAPVALVLLASALLLRFPPTQYGFYPQCPIHHYLGILCPGCGTTRAFAALLHGHLGEALRLNPLTTLSLPLAAGWAVRARKPLRWPEPPPSILYAGFGLIALFTVVRNL